VVLAAYRVARVLEHHAQHLAHGVACQHTVQCAAYDTQHSQSQCTHASDGHVHSTNGLLGRAHSAFGRGSTEADMCHYAFLEEGGRPMHGAVDILIHEHHIAGGDLFLQAAT
jgi:hypothetical protein